MEPKKFQTTIDSIDKIVKEVGKNRDKSDNEIITALGEVLGVPYLYYNRERNYDRQEQIKLVKAIHSYQDRKFNKPLGYIDDKRKQTISSLKQDIESKL